MQPDALPTGADLAASVVAFFTAGFSKLITCGVIILICLLAVRISTFLIRRFFEGRIAQNRHVDTAKANTLGSIVSSIASYAIYFVGICSILIELGVPSTSLAAVLGTGTVAIGLAAQNVIKDIIAGFFILLEDQFSVGDTISTQGLTGTVEEISIRATRIRADDGTLHIIPNGSITIVSNMNKEFITAIVETDVAYEENLGHVFDVLQDEMEKTSDLEGLQQTPVLLGVTALGANGVTLRITAKCEPGAKYRIERELRLRIKNRLDQESISIPYSQCMIHFAEKE